MPMVKVFGKVKYSKLVFVTDIKHKQRLNTELTPT